MGVFPISSVTLDAIFGDGLDPLLLLAFTASETGAWQQTFRCGCCVRLLLQFTL